MAHTIYKWEQIEHHFKDSTLLIGNGASMALDSKFSYQSLKKFAEKNGNLEKDVLTLFQEFETNDFEYILRIVWHAAIVNSKLGIADDRVQKAYTNVRKALIESVQAIHSNYSEIESQLSILYQFIKKFKTIISLNYDLILYWIIMYGNTKRDGHKFKDCFINGEFKTDWQPLRTPKDDSERDITLVFYPHGNLSLVRNIYDQELKIKSNHFNLLNEILESWGRGDCIPLFISEGTSDRKLKSIHSSNYLSIVYHEVLSNIFNPLPRNVVKPDSNNLVIYGWALGEHDKHIIEKILKGRVYDLVNNHKDQKIAISLYDPSQADCYRVEKIIKDIMGVTHLQLQLYFFDSQSSGCWINS